MAARRPVLSLIVPTRGRPDRLRRLLQSIARTASRPQLIEVVLVVDDDDRANYQALHSQFSISCTVGPAGRTMGALNIAGYEASRGDYVMLLNDDVIVRTRGWDRIVRRCLRRFPDSVALIHVNDTLIRDYLCTFPILSRKYCESIGGICPEGYRRYRIDDHIEDIFNMLAVLGERRSVYLPDVVFEHTNTAIHPTAGAVYASDPGILAQDAPLFDALASARKAAVLKVLDYIEGGSDPSRTAERRAILDAITDPFALRVSGRQQIVRGPRWFRARREFLQKIARIRTCYRRAGLCGVAVAIGRRLVGSRVTSDSM